MAEKDMDAGPSNSLDESIEHSLGFASENFDPMRVLYASDLGFKAENVKVYNCVSQFMSNVNISSSSSGTENSANENSSAPAQCSQPVPRSSTIQETELPTAGDECVKKETVGVTNMNTVSEPEQTNPVSQFTDKEKVDLQSQDQKFVADSDTQPATVISASERRKATENRRRKHATRNLLSEMENGFHQGPLNLLKRSVAEKLKVRVWTRSVRNVRGISTGYVIAFDKHMNLAMMDVDEVYRKPVGKHQKKSKKREIKPVPKADSCQDDEEADSCYPKAPWQPIGQHSVDSDSAMISASVSGCNNSDNDDASNGYTEGVPADGIGDLPSAFRGMHVFEETESTRLLGTKARRVLSRHLNQVLLRGDHVVAIALAE